MIKVSKGRATLAVLVASILSLNVGAKELPQLTTISASYDEVGVLDAVATDSITVSDELYKVTKLTNCYDENGRKDIGCFSLKKARWVALKFDSVVVSKVIVVKSIHQLSEKQYKALSHDD